MIVYDTNFNFLGISSDSLSLLGYEDISIFLESNQDVADLFIKKPGFIHKFNNFSWISYVLNGAAPTKDVLIQLKNGNQLHATLNITEIYTKDKGKLYTVELSNTVVAEQTISEEEFSKKESIFKIFDDSIEAPAIKNKQSLETLDNVQEDNIKLQSEDTTIDNAEDILSKVIEDSTDSDKAITNDFQENVATGNIDNISINVDDIKDDEPLIYSALNLQQMHQEYTKEESINLGNIDKFEIKTFDNLSEDDFLNFEIKDNSNFVDNKLPEQKDKDIDLTLNSNDIDFLVTEDEQKNEVKSEFEDYDFDRLQSQDSIKSFDDDFTISLQQNIEPISFNVDNINFNDTSQEEDIFDNIAKEYDFEKDKVKEYFEEYLNFVLDEFNKLDRYFKDQNLDLVNYEIVRLIGASNILNLTNIADNLKEIIEVDTIDEKITIVDNIKSTIEQLISKIKG